MKKMKRMKRMLQSLPAILLAALLLQGCSLLSLSEPATQNYTVSVPTTEQQETQALPDTPKRSQNGGARDYLPDGLLEPIAFDDMEYQRPDTQALTASFDALTAQVEAQGSCDEVLQAYYAVSDAYVNFYTMDTLANIHYYTDMTDEYYEQEYDYLESQSPEVEKALEGFNKACAVSPLKAELESAYFGEGYFDEYIDYSRYTNPEYLALVQREEAVLTKYRQAVAEPTVRYNGEEQSFEELLEEYAQDYSAYYAVLQAYYDKYNPIIADYYIELLSIRKQLAGSLGYASYADYCYDMEYGRDYTAQIGTAYTEAIMKQLVPVYEDWRQEGDYYADYTPADEAQVRAVVREAAEHIGGEVWEAYRFMEEYGYSDLTKSPRKMNASFTTYLYNWETPYLFVNAEGSTQDMLTFAHEFGHYTDFYVNYGADEDLETAETFSQSMEYLTLCYAHSTISEDQREELLKGKLADALQTFVNQAAYADFENRVFALPEGTVTVQTLNDTYRQIMIDYGFYSESLDFYFSKSWIDVHHFFEAPYYVISYCVSADTSLQICQREQEREGSGLALYQNLLQRDSSQGVQALIQSAGMDDPFRTDRMQELSMFFREELDLP